MTDDEKVLIEKAEEIRALAKGISRDIVKVGRLLSEAKAACRHGEWQAWLEFELGWNVRSAQRYMELAKFADKNDIVSLSGISLNGLLILAQRSTPKIVRDKVIARAKAGEKVLPRTIRLLLEEQGKEPIYTSLKVVQPEGSSRRSPLVTINIKVEKIKLALDHVDKIEDLMADFPEISEMLDGLRQEIEKHLKNPSKLELVR